MKRNRRDEEATGGRCRLRRREEEEGTEGEGGWRLEEDAGGRVGSWRMENPHGERPRGDRTLIDPSADRARPRGRITLS